MPGRRPPAKAPPDRVNRCPVRASSSTRAGVSPALVRIAPRLRHGDARGPRHSGRFDLWRPAKRPSEPAQTSTTILTPCWARSVQSVPSLGPAWRAIRRRLPPLDASLKEIRWPCSPDASWTAPQPPARFRDHQSIEGTFGGAVSIGGASGTLAAMARVCHGVPAASARSGRWSRASCPELGRHPGCRLSSGAFRAV